VHRIANPSSSAGPAQWACDTPSLQAGLASIVRALALLVVLASVTSAIGTQERTPPAEVTNSVDMPFVLLPTEAGAVQPLYVSRTEVTLGQFHRFMPSHDNGRTPWGRVLNEPDLPAVGVTVVAAKSFCEWLGQRDGGAYRLPTSGEWERACLAGRKARYSCGDDAFQLKHYAWYAGTAAGVLASRLEKGPRPVGRKLPNAWGLFDLHGNVWEWCVDADGQVSARGGGWNSPADQCTATSILRAPPASEVTIGFRLVMTRPPADDNHGQHYWQRVGRKFTERLLADRQAIPDKARVAVIPLDVDGRGITQLGVALAGGIESAVIETARCRLVDRQTLEQVLREKDLAFADLSDMSRAAQATRLLSADFLINGTLTDTGNELQAAMRLVNVPGGEVVATAAFPLPKDDHAAPLMKVVVQRASHRPATGGELPPLALNYDVLAQREVSPGRFEEVIVRDGATLHSGDQYRIRVQPNSDCHFYILTVDSREEVYILFPRSEIQVAGRIRGGMTCMIPGEHDPWYTLDENTGTETLIFIASYEPLNDLDALLRKVRAAGGTSASVGSAIRHEVDRLSTAPDAAMTAGGYPISKTRGTVLSRPKASYVLSGGRSVQNMMAVVEGHSRVIQTISFNHVR
jgi:formylglycine-generating enzyme required for sulfatase activity